MLSVSDTIVIYSKDSCPFCEMAISLASSTDKEVTVLKLDVDYTVEDFQAKFPYAKSVPQIIVDEEHIGGYQDLLKNLV